MPDWTHRFLNGRRTQTPPAVPELMAFWITAGLSLRRRHRCRMTAVHASRALEEHSSGAIPGPAAPCGCTTPFLAYHNGEEFLAAPFRRAAEGRA